jgi:hypothetical protein
MRIKDVIGSRMENIYGKQMPDAWKISSQGYDSEKKV